MCVIRPNCAALSRKMEGLNENEVEATGDQMGKMLKLLEAQQQQQMQLQEALMQQMQKLTTLQAENITLRDAAANTGAVSTPATTNANPDEQRYKSKKPDRPTIDRDLDDREWALLMDKWGRYKTMCNIKPTDVETIRLELRAACTDDVDKLLFEFVGASVLDGCTEAQLLEHIKSVTVKHTHKEAEFDVLRKDKEVLEKDAETAAAKAKELEEKATKLEGDKGQLEEQTKAYVLIIIGLVGLITLFLLFQCLRACCCGGSKTVAAERGNIVRYENMLRLLILDYLTAEISPLFHNMKRSLQIPTLSLNQKILRPRKRRRRQRNRKRKKRKMSERLDASTNIT